MSSLKRILLMVAIPLLVSASLGLEEKPSSDNTVALIVFEETITDYAKKKVADQWETDEWSSFNQIVLRESGWNSDAQNPTSTAHGLCQFLKATYAYYGEKTSDPEKQIDMCIRYMQDRYGTPTEALAFHHRNNWY